MMNTEWLSEDELAETLWKKYRNHQDNDSFPAVMYHNFLAAIKEAVVAERQKVAELTEKLGWLYDKWENGDPCFENPDEHENSLGNAFRLSYEEENSILALIPSAKSDEFKTVVDHKFISDTCHKDGCQYLVLTEQRDKAQQELIVQKNGNSLLQSSRDKFRQQAEALAVRIDAVLAKYQPTEEK